MQSSLKPDSPVPLYHQLAQALHYRIATGELRPGTRLPSIRAAATLWGVNLHTVRHAYSTLADQGLVRLDRARGTIVLGGPARDATAVDRFIARVVREAAERHALTSEELQRRLAIAGHPPVEQPLVLVIECSENQAADLAGQLEAHFDVRAEPWSLERPAEPPNGATLVATYFHYNDLRVRWPKRFPSVQFVAIRPDPRLAGVLGRLRGRCRRLRVVVCEREETMAAAIAADLTRVLPADRFEITAVVRTDPADALAEFPEETPVLFAPRVWGSMAPKDRANPRSYEVRYIFDAVDLAALGKRTGWRAHDPAVASRVGAVMI